MEISAIVATNNDEKLIKHSLTALSRLQNVSQVIVADAASRDETREICEKFTELRDLKIIDVGNVPLFQQLNEGANAADHQILWFVFPFITPKRGSAAAIKKYLGFDEILGGNFDVSFDGTGKRIRFLEWINANSHTSQIAYFESGIYVRKDIFQQMNGFRDRPMDEDADFFRRLNKKGRTKHIDIVLSVRPERFSRKRFFLKWSLNQILFQIGVPRKFIPGFLK